MTLCFIADFRSSIARNWIRYFAGRCRVHVLSTQPARAMEGVDLHPLVAGSGEDRAEVKRRWARWIDTSAGSGRLLGWGRNHWWLPATGLRLARRARRLIGQLQPDLVHSLRIPIEGEIGGRARGSCPHVISAWGNDFTLFADQSPAHAWLTRAALRDCAGFMADAEADVARARRYGLRADAPVLVVPGAGGVDTDVFRPTQGESAGGACLGMPVPLPRGARLVVNARGFRSYVRNDTFFQAAAEVAARRDDVYFVGVGLAGWRPAEELVARLGIAERVRLTGPLSQLALADLHRRSALMVSPTEHDGTPNTLLEAMACGALPVCGDLPSIREWITDGENGLLVPVDRPGPLREAMLRGLDDGALVRRAREQGPAIVEGRAEYSRSMALAEEFYGRLLARRSTAVGAKSPSAELAAAELAN